MIKKITINLFVLIFLLASCSSGSKSQISTAAQRAVETREYDVDVISLMQSTIGAFQDLGFTVDTLNEEFGLITASKIEIPENKDEEGMSAGAILGIILIIGALIALDDKFPENNEDRKRDKGETVVVKDYKLTATVTVKPIKDSKPFVSSLRVNFGGAQRSRSVQFFKDFFSTVDKSLFLDQSI